MYIIGISSAKGYVSLISEFRYTKILQKIRVYVRVHSDLMNKTMAANEH